MSFSQAVRVGVILGAGVFCTGLLPGDAEPAPGAPVAVRPAFTDGFAQGEANWETMGGTWQAADGKLVAEQTEGADALAYAPRAPLLQEQTLEATVTVQRRLIAEGWSVCGVLVFLDPSTYWVLGLTEDPKGNRYLDFLEKYQGVWQAQNEGGTRLERTVNENLHLKWSHNTEYRLRLALDGEGIGAEVRAGAGGEPLARARYEFGKAEALRMGSVALLARGCAATFDDVAVTAPEAQQTSSSVRVESGREGSIAVLRDATLPESDPSVADHLASAFRAAGFGVTFLDGRQASDPSVLAPQRFFLYVIPHAQVYPATGAPALMSYLRRQGHLMVLGGPAFTRQVWDYQGQWVDQQMIRARVAQRQAEHTFLDFEGQPDLKAWTRATNDNTIQSALELEPGGHDGKGQCLRMSMQNLAGWNTYASPVLEGMFAQGHALLCFWAKGDAQTSQLSVEMNEADGSRWIAVVPLETDWKYHVLTPDQFAYWPDSKTKDTRGRPGDRFNPAAANRIVMGLAQSHTTAVGGVPHTLWVDDFGTAPNPFADFRTGPSQTLLPMETISPTYKVYPLDGIASVKVATDQALLDPTAELPTPRSALSCFARPKGEGFGNGGKWRWVPLARALDKQGEERGTAMWLLLNNTFPYKQSLFAAVGIDDAAVLKNHRMTGALVEVVRRMRLGVFLREAGARQFSYWRDEPIELGTECTNTGAKPATITARFAVTGATDGRTYLTKERQLELAPGASKRVSFTWRPDRYPTDAFVVRTELLDSTGVLDVLTQEVGLLSAKPAARDDFVTVKGSDFYLKGKKWYPVGINYWPVYVSGSEAGDYSLGWLTPGFYDPDEVERDLVRMEALGINMVSVQTGAPDGIRNLLDFLRRCERHGIKVNGFLGAASPLGFDEKAVADFLREARLVDNPTLFAYDIIWEPGNYVFNSEGRPRWDPDWKRWIVERYGSLENAEVDWAMPAPRIDGKLTSPTDRQLREDGEWRVMVAAYRRFMDDLMSRKWNDATRKVRALDPNHLVSFRQGNTLPHDFAFTATPKHIDFICPEGYSIPLGEDGYDASGFITRYVHFTTGGKPVLWSEFGKSVWGGKQMRPDPAAIATQGEYHHQFYRMVLESGANGTAPWWWPGGYRVNEKSDFGITNPDGTPRPSAALIRKYAKQMKAAHAYPKPDTWMTIDRDANAGGYWYLTFNSGKDAYRDARRQGKHLGIRTAGTGTDSATCPLVAVGNAPYTGKNPPKYLNAEFNSLQFRDANGHWVDVENGAQLEVPKNAPVVIRASVGNTQEAKWLTPASANGKPGAVYLASTEDSSVKVRVPIPADAPSLSDADFGEVTLTPGIAEKTTVVLQMTAEGRAWFGEKLRLVLVPVG